MVEAESANFVGREGGIGRPGGGPGHGDPGGLHMIEWEAEYAGGRADGVIAGHPVGAAHVVDPRRVSFEEKRDGLRDVGDPRGIPDERVITRVRLRPLQVLGDDLREKARSGKIGRRADQQGDAQDEGSGPCEGGVLSIESSSEIGDVHEEMEVEQQGADSKITFNVKYMLDVMRTIEDGRLEMNFNTSITPCVINPVDNRDYLHLVLPVRTQA